VAADAHPQRGRYLPATTWQVAVAAARHPAFLAAISVLGAHDTCGIPTLGYRCESTAIARRLRRPLWESELGTLDGNSGAANMARSINHGYSQAGITGYIEWPLLDSMPPGLRYENRTGGLKPGVVHVRATNLLSAKPSTWFVRRADLHVSNGRPDPGPLRDCRFGGLGQLHGVGESTVHDRSGRRAPDRPVRNPGLERRLVHRI